MNDSSQLNMQGLNRDVCLNTVLYLSKYYEDDTTNGAEVKNILETISQNMDEAKQAYIDDGHTAAEAEKEFSEDMRKLSVLENAVKNDPEMGELVMANQTYMMNDPATGEPYEEGGIFACTFQDKLDSPSEVTVVYRGTGEGEWYDNGLALGGEMVSSEQQEKAREYFDTIVRENGWDQSQPDIHMTGHSKGGNSAQYVNMTSDYSHLIDDVYSIDGQGMSPEAIEYMKNKLGKDEYDRRREKMYSISADNDYVNVLGTGTDGRVIPDDHIFYLESNLSGMAWHYTDCLLNEDGTLTNFTEQGEVSKFVESFSELGMDLPPEIRSIITRGAMGIAEMFLGNGNPVNGEELSWAEILGAIPLLIEMIPGTVIKYLGDKFGVNVDWLANAITAVSIIFMTPVINGRAYLLGTAIDLILDAVEKIKAFGQKCIELTEKVVAFIRKGVSKLEKFLKSNFNKGYQYASENPYINVNTAALRSYANRLTAVNKRLAKLDTRMDALYKKVGLRDLLTLLKADLMTTYSLRLTGCAKYLNETASDFEKVEREIAGLF